VSRSGEAAVPTVNHKGFAAAVLLRIIQFMSKNGLRGRFPQTTRDRTAGRLMS
jgi:hypothetical protein